MLQLPSGTPVPVVATAQSNAVWRQPAWLVAGRAHGYRLHHGTLNAVYLPAVLRFNEPAVGEKYKRVAALLGLPEREANASGVANAVVALNEVGKVVEALGQNRAVKLAPKVLAPTSRGAPETLLLVGDDRRPPPKGNPNGFVVPHSNEMLLVRIDPSKPTISMLSIPRELQVAIQPPGARPVVNRINVAYTIGGIQLMTETILPLSAPPFLMAPTPASY